MSSINLDLDFHDYAPSNTSGNKPFSQQPEAQLRIPSLNENNQTQNTQKSRSVLQNVLLNMANFQAGQSPVSGISDEAMQQLIWLSGKQRNKQQRESIAASSNWGLGYFAQYFDVSLEDVLQRIVWSALPIRKSGVDLSELGDEELTAPLANNMSSGNVIDSDTFSPSSIDAPKNSLTEQIGKRKHYSYMERFIQSRPDFYGPFWISITFIFAVALFSNIVSFKAHKFKVNHLEEITRTNNSSSDISIATLGQLEDWHYSIDELNSTVSLVILYVTILPTFLWFFFWFRGCNSYYTLLEMICAYGYSLSIFIPLSAFLMIQATFFRYIVLILASLSTGFVLVMSLLPVVNSDPRKGGSHIILVIVLVCQIGLAYILNRLMLQ